MHVEETRTGCWVATKKTCETKRNVEYYPHRVCVRSILTVIIKLHPDDASSWTRVNEIIMANRTVEYEALRKFYEATNGAEWGVDHEGAAYNENWLSSTSFCGGSSTGWKGIGCRDTWDVWDAETNPIRYLGWLPINGSLPTELGVLSLKQIEFGVYPTPEVRIDGTLPTELGSVTWIQLSSTALSGTIPSQLCNMTYLQLDTAELSGTIPTEFGSVTWIELASRRSLFSGTIPSQLYNMTYLHLGPYTISGTIPKELFDNSSGALQAYNVGHNRVSGTIPTTFGKLQQLQHFYSESTSLSGTLPTELGSPWTSLTVLHLDQNHHSGSLPTQLGALEKLTQFTVYGNVLSGFIPSELKQWDVIQMCQFTWWQEDFRVQPYERNAFYCPLKYDNLNYACKGNLFCTAPPSPPPPLQPPSPPPPHLPPSPTSPPLSPPLPGDAGTVVLTLVLLLLAALACAYAYVKHRSMKQDAQRLVEIELKEREDKAAIMMVRYGGSRESAPLTVALRQAVSEVVPSLPDAPQGSAVRFTTSFADLRMGPPVASALGVISRLGVAEDALMAQLASGVRAIEAEVARNGTDDDRENLHYVLHERAGSSPKLFPNSSHRRDYERNGEQFFDFVAAPQARMAQLSAAHVLSLRLYTTSTFQSINAPLRDESRTTPHPLPSTVAFLNEAIRRLRAVEAASGGDGKADTAPTTAYEALDLWRGLKDCRSTADFDAHGGSEFAPMSTTSELKVAVAYASSSAPFLLKIATSGFINRGADLSWVSCFADECVFPPLTYLEPTGRQEEVDVRGVVYKVVEVTPHL